MLQVEDQQTKSNPANGCRQLYKVPRLTSHRINQSPSSTRQPRIISTNAHETGAERPSRSRLCALVSIDHVQHAFSATTAHRRTSSPQRPPDDLRALLTRPGAHQSPLRHATSISELCFPYATCNMYHLQQFIPHQPSARRAQSQRCPIPSLHCLSCRRARPSVSPAWTAPVVRHPEERFAHRDMRIGFRRDALCTRTLISTNNNR